MTPPGNSVPFDIVFFPISCQIGALPKIRRLFDHVTSASSIALLNSENQIKSKIVREA
uniref:TYROSINE PHOSPHATASE 1 family protein n=1 Tax=Rhizophora mucronata TaxID=61149 RepID=A0A2P2LCA0_RHIMU